MARKTSVRALDGQVARRFLDEHHLWGSTKAKHSYGLFEASGELAAVATFSRERRFVRAGEERRSHELLRYCAARDARVVGGITKLLAAFRRDVDPDDVVTNVDRDWGTGHAQGRTQTEGDAPSTGFKSRSGDHRESETNSWRLETS